MLLDDFLAGRTALLMAIDNENLEMIELLLEFKVVGEKSALVIITMMTAIIMIIPMAIIVINMMTIIVITMAIITTMTAIIKKLWQVETKDALLHAISEQYVEAVEVPDHKCS